MQSHSIRMAAGKKASSGGSSGPWNYLDNTYWDTANWYLGADPTWDSNNNRWHRPGGTFGDFIPINGWEVGFRPNQVTIDIEVLDETESSGNQIQIIDTTDTVVDSDTTNYGIGTHSIILDLSSLSNDIKALQFGDYGLYDEMYITNIVFE